MEAIKNIRRSLTFNVFNKVASSNTAVNYDAVREDLKDIMQNPDHDDGSYAPVLIRLGWHSSGTYDAADGSGGSNGAGMRFPLEGGDPENRGLAIARDILEPIKRRHPGISYSDLWVLAAYVALEVTGGPVIDFTPGRVDKTEKEAALAPGRLPEAEHGTRPGYDSEGRVNGWENLAGHIRHVFGRMGFTDNETVALIAGGHMYGRCHKENSGYQGAWVEKPTEFSNEFAADLIQDEWMPVESDTTVNGEPIPDETRPAPGKRQYMGKWEPTPVEALQNASPDEYPPGRYRVAVGWINVRRGHQTDSYVIDQPKKGAEFNVVNIRQFEKGVRGQLMVGGWVSILTSNGQDHLLERVSDLALKPGTFRMLPGTSQSAYLFSAPPGQVGIDFGDKGLLKTKTVLVADEFVYLKNEQGFVVEIYGRVAEGEAAGSWIRLVDSKLGAVFEKVIPGYNDTPKQAIKKLQVQHQMMLPSDMVMLWDDGFKAQLQKYADDAELLKNHFGAAYKKLTELGVPGCE